MITVALSGGLGNQMFQYAAGRALALQLESEVALDLTSYIANRGRSWVRDFDLDVFNHQAVRIDTSVSWKIKYAWKLVPKIRQYSWGQRFLLMNRVFRDKNSYAFDPRFHHLKDPFTLLGYFQSEKYFLPYREILLKEFTLKVPLNKANRDMAEKIAATNAVSVHIRRGDYITNPYANKVFAECSVAYYRAAMEKIRQQADHLVFYFFSDDIEWVKQNLGDQVEAVYVDFNFGKDSCNDMYLMSLCKYNIIANSSFSWWGAWLNQNPGKIVVAPRKWFKSPEANATIADLIPESWMKL